MEDNNWKFPPKDFSRKYLQVCLPILPVFSDKFKIHNTHQREIENILLKTNNKRNSTIGDSVKKSYGYCNQVLDRCNTNYLCHAGLGSLNQISDRLRRKKLRRETDRSLIMVMIMIAR